MADAPDVFDVSTRVTCGKGAMIKLSQHHTRNHVQVSASPHKRLLRSKSRKTDWGRSRSSEGPQRFAQMRTCVFRLHLTWGMKPDFQGRNEMLPCEPDVVSAWLLQTARRPAARLRQLYRNGEALGSGQCPTCPSRLWTKAASHSRIESSCQAAPAELITTASQRSLSPPRHAFCP